MRRAQISTSPITLNNRVRRVGLNKPSRLRAIAWKCERAGIRRRRKPLRRRRNQLDHLSPHRYGGPSDHFRVHGLRPGYSGDGGPASPGDAQRPIRTLRWTRWAISISRTRRKWERSAWSIRRALSARLSQFLNDDRAFPQIHGNWHSTPRAISMCPTITTRLVFKVHRRRRLSRSSGWRRRRIPGNGGLGDRCGNHCQHTGIVCDASGNCLHRGRRSRDSGGAYSNTAHDLAPAKESFRFSRQRGGAPATQNVSVLGTVPGLGFRGVGQHR